MNPSLPSVALAAALALPAAGVAQVVPGPPACQVIVEFPRDDTSPGRRPPGSVSATTTDDLTVAVLLPFPLGGDRVLRLEYLTPRGHRYQGAVAPVSETPKLVHLPGYPRPMAARVPARTQAQGQPVSRVELSFPVGGTSITASSLYGTWQIVPYLDDEERPCGPPATVEILP